jgi:hypothetical protein
MTVGGVVSEKEVSWTSEVYLVYLIINTMKSFLIVNIVYIYISVYMYVCARACIHDCLQTTIMHSL